VRTSARRVCRHSSIVCFSLFSESELDLLIAGQPTIDVDDWRANTAFITYTAESEVVTWFWQALGEFSQVRIDKTLI
jgi:E3 ubiquitin-protein ligase HUWE1